MEKKNIFKELIIVFWLFIIGSIVGYFIEIVVVLFQKGFFETRQGLIYGPFIPVYGIGIILYYLILDNIKTKSKLKVFVITSIVGGVTEYICSYVQEKCFGTISWDYSNLIFDINGRTSLLHCTYWGLAGVIYAIWLIPLIDKLKVSINKKYMKVITSILAIFMLFDVFISCMAAQRQTERRKNIEPTSKVDKLLDKYYPDEYMNHVYNNKKEVDIQ